jgi:transposase-like protein
MSMARLVITAVTIEGRSKSEVAREYGVSRVWVQKLIHRFEADGEAAFEPRFVLAVSGLQRGLLRQVQHLHSARRPAMVTGEVGGEFGLSDVDDLRPSRPALVQPRINADDLPDRPLRLISAGPFGEPHPKGPW